MIRSAAAAVALTLVSATAAQAATSANDDPAGSGRCAAATNRTIHGSVVGQDGLAVNTSIGFDLVDSAGRKIDLVTGCVIVNSYSAVLELNHFIDTSAPVGTEQVGHSGEDQGPVQTAFTLNHLPANAAHVYAEAYPRSFSPHCAPFVYSGVNRATDRGITTGCLGQTSLSHYGRALRRFASIGTTLKMVLPTTPAFGGSTGSIFVRGAGVTSVYARSDAKDGTKLMSWGTADPQPGGAAVWALASKQTYTVVITEGGRTVVKNKVKVSPGHQTTISG